MKIKGSKIAAVNWSNIGLPVIFVLCLFFFFAGFFGSSLFSQQELPRNLRVREMVEETIEFNALPHGISGENSVEAISFQILSWNPRALYFPNFATAEQCQSIIEMAKVHLKPSSLALREGETAENTQGIRTSSGMFISVSEDKTGILGRVEEKIAKATMIPRSNGESFNVLRYEIGQRYLHIMMLSIQLNMVHRRAKGKFQVASFLLYLSDVEEGGETMFPFENGQNMDNNYDFQKCIGLKVKPHRGDGLLFYSLFPNGTIDPRSLHGSCPVIKGEIWVATKWIRDQVRGDDS